MQPVQPRRHYFALDFVRFLAAMTVMVSHYWAFNAFSIHGPAAQELTDHLPLRHLLKPIYESGITAVALFWMISGFVFACTYENQRPSASDFFIARFSRLYPLHFVTLLSVALIQIFALKAFGPSQMFGNNDIYHFILNLFFISAWGFQKGLSFNGPIWSVSVEIAIYIVFYLTIPLLQRSLVLAPIVLGAIFLGLMKLDLPGAFWACGYFFYIGVLVFTALNYLGQRAVAVSLGMLAIYIAAKLSLPDLPTLPLLSLAFAAVILLASGLDGMPRMTSAFRKISWLGDSTYGIYLCHMPFIWTASCVFNLTQLNRAKIVASPWFLLLYVVAVLGLGRLAFVYLELPAKRAIRNWYARRSAAKIGVAASAQS